MSVPEELKKEQERMDFLLDNFNSEILKKNIENINDVKNLIEKAKNLIIENKNNEAVSILDECKVNLSYLNLKVKDIEIGRAHV